MADPHPSGRPGALLYEGKAKRVFEVVPADESEAGSQLWLEFKDSLTAFNALKKGSFQAKGAINRDIAALIFAHLQAHGVLTHFVASEGEREMRVLKLEMILLEVVVRNRLAGSTAKKFSLAEGTPLETPLVEFFYKNDSLNDPFISDEQALMLKVASLEELSALKKQALHINSLLRELFGRAQIELIDFKIEFGRDSQGVIYLADEISPDSCRLWDEVTSEKLDKDRFRRDMDRIEESYREVLKRLRGQNAHRS